MYRIYSFFRKNNERSPSLQSIGDSFAIIPSLKIESVYNLKLGIYSLTCLKIGTSVVRHLCIEPGNADAKTLLLSIYILYKLYCMNSLLDLVSI